MPTETIFIPVAELKAWVTCVLTHEHIPVDEAAVASEVLVSANLRGVDSHGVVRLPIYIKRLRAGAVNPRPQVRVDREHTVSALVNGDNGLGVVVGVWAMREAIRRAQASGVGMVSVYASNHFGAAAYYAQMATAANMLGIVATNTDAGMAPWGSVTPYIGTNPLAFAAPGGIAGGIVMDMATSQVAWGKIMLAARAGEKIPIGWATDRAGRPTDDAHEAVKGLMLPLGGYKGFGLAMMIEILCGILSGAAFGPHVPDDYAEPYQAQAVGHFFTAIQIEAFMPLALFQARMDQMVDEIHACQLANGVTRLYVPGEIELDTARRREREGIPLPGSVYADLIQIGELVSQPFPALIKVRSETLF